MLKKNGMLKTWRSIIGLKNEIPLPEIRESDEPIDDNSVIENVIRSVSALNLPIATYVVNKEGVIAYCDQKAEEILGADATGKEMISFYHDKSSREKLFDDLDLSEAKGRPLQKTVLHLKARGQEIFVQDFTRTICDAEGRRIGLLCCMMEYTRELRSTRLYETLPTAIYELDRAGVVIDGNERLASLLGYRKMREIKGKNIKSFYVDREAAAEISEMLRAGGSVVDLPVELYRKNGDTIFAAATATLIMDENGQVCGWEGTLTDITTHERYRRLIEQMPIGLYLTKRRQGEEYFDDCNDTFAHINGYSSAEELRGKKVSAVHLNTEEYLKFLKTAEGPEQPHIQRIKIRHERKVVEVVTRSFRSKSGAVSGRVGGGRDVTAEESNREWLEVISRYIGNVLHTYQSSLISLDSSLEVLAEYYGERSGSPLPFNAEAAAKVAQTLAPALVSQIEELLRLRDLEGSEVRSALGGGGWASLCRNLEFLKGNMPDPSELHLAFLRDAALEVLRLLRLDREALIPRDLWQDISRSADALAKAACAQTIRFARSRIAEMSWEIKSLRDAVVSRSVKVADRAVLELNAVVSAVAVEHHDYARSRGIELRVAVPGRPIKVRGMERDLLRALGNLVHNAIKYSWTRHDVVFVQVRLQSDRTWAIIEVENWGVPVLATELDLVFKEGFRGSLSGDRQRTGTGLGLADAKRVIEESGGRISLTSNPVGGTDRRSSDRPYLTIVRIQLPLM